MSFYTTEDELLTGIEIHRRDDALRRRRAEAGWRRYFQLFDVTRVSKYIVDSIFGKVDPATFDWLASSRPLD